MENWLWAGLTVIIAFGLTTLAAVALANVVGLRLHDWERPSSHGDRVYLYLSDEAQELRQRFRKLPRSFRTIYLFFVFGVVFSMILMFCLREEILVSRIVEKLPFSLAEQEQGVVIFITAMAVTYTVCMVIRTANMSSCLYRILQNTHQHPS